ncbi:hypothetical protein DB35_17460 [Streptomyces abyssalis]|uniref:Methyltransferase domain-containing protein n=1 Tax=Streptomyces abyssalis TaxID=933944 RepID=A0A1E7JKK0_9ACTN|nr:class I SAM-dependent methyltransferase [Streptomyces abyssalis]OEU88180.1 hypothetical protein AN215_18630 [Streptomyces abyssalis]OEU91051.1 hypothetical protein DB35_17460 [Streptomyces abyssalis]
MTKSEAAPQVDDPGYGRRFADFYDKLFPKNAGAEATAEALASMAGGGPALELGVGTGRIAIPLAERIGAVIGVDSSPEMLEELRRDVERAGAPVQAVHGDLRTYEDECSYPLVYLVCGTLSMVLDPEQQRQAVARAAHRVAPGGRLVIENFNTPGILAMSQDSGHFTSFAPYPDPNTGLLTSWLVEKDTGLWQSSHAWFEDNSFRIASDVNRLIPPEEVDRYAIAAGLELVHRWSDWQGTAYDERGAMYIAVYEVP